MFQRNQCIVRRVHPNGILYIIIRHQVQIVHLIDVSGLGILIVHLCTGDFCVQHTRQILDCIVCLFHTALCRTVRILINIGIGIGVNGGKDCRKLVGGYLLRIAVGSLSKGRRGIGVPLVIGEIVRCPVDINAVIQECTGVLGMIRRQVFPVTQHSSAVISVCLFRLEVQLEAVDICLDIGFLISRIGIGSENAGICLIQLPQNLFHINGIDFLALYGFRCADMHHIDAVCHAVYAGAFYHVHRNVRAAHLECQICHAEPVVVQKEFRQVDMLQPVAAVHGVGGSRTVNTCSRLLPGRILLVLIEQLHAEQAAVRCVVVALAVIIVQLFRYAAILRLQLIPCPKIDQVAHDYRIVRLLVDFLVRFIICGNTGLSSVLSVHVIVCLVDRIRLALHQNIPCIGIVIICLFLVGQFRRIIPCTRNIIHGHAVVCHKSIFAQNHNIFSAVLFYGIGRFDLRLVCSGVRIVCVSLGAAACIVPVICVVLLFRCVLEINVPVIGFAVHLFQFRHRNRNGLCRSDNVIVRVLRIYGEHNVVVISEILIDLFLDLKSGSQKALVFVVIIRPDLRQAVRQHNLIREGKLIHPVVLIGTEVRAVHCPMVNIVIRCIVTHTAPSRVDVRCRNGAFFGVALPIKTDRETVVLSEFCIAVFRCSGSFADTLLHIVLIVDDMHTCAGLQMLCGIVEYLIGPIVSTTIIIIVTGPGIILVCEGPIRLFLVRTGVCPHLTSAIGGFAHSHISMCCSNRLIHAVETSGNFKHSLCGRIRLVIPDAIVRRLCRFAVIVDSLIAVDVNGHNDLCHRIFRILSVIALRLLIIVGIVRGEHVRIAAQQIQPCKASVCIALVGFIENFLSGTGTLGAVCIDRCNRLNIVLGTRVNFQIVRIECVRRQV